MLSPNEKKGGHPLLWAIFLFAAMLALAAWLSPRAHAQGAPKQYLTTASNNATLVLGRPATVSYAWGGNTTATTYFLKLYDKQTIPVCGTDIPVVVIALPAGGAPSGVAAPGMIFANGVGFCVVAGLANTDNTSATTGIAVNIGISGR